MIPILSALRHNGVLGMNRRNAGFTLRCNPRKFYPRVDDKLTTKRHCQEAGIPVPELLAVATHHFELRELARTLATLDRFALKPSHGAMGNGILVVNGRDGDDFIRTNGRRLDLEDLRYHAAGIISGLYSLGGQDDAAMVEEMLEVHPEMAEVAVEGVPDVRVIIYRGFPIMAMTRLPTRESDGRANLHQGAVGAGIHLRSGKTIHAVQNNRPIRSHPDSGVALVGRDIPDFERVLQIAVQASDWTGLGYVGADVVVDARWGAVILELNARPGLSIQVANRAGLLPRLRAVDRGWAPDLSAEDRLERGRDIIAAL